MEFVDCPIAMPIPLDTRARTFVAFLPHGIPLSAPEALKGSYWPTAHSFLIDSDSMLHERSWQLYHHA